MKTDRYIKIAKNALSAAAVIGAVAASGNAEAQTRGVMTPQGATRPAVPRTNQAPVIPSHLASGVRIRGQSSLSFYYQRGIPFLNNYPGIRGYIYGDLWFPIGMWPMSYLDVRTRQFIDVRTRYNAWGQPYLEPSINVTTGDQSPVNIGGNQNVSYGLSGEEVREIVSEILDVRQPARIDAPQDERISVDQRYSGMIDKIQYADEGIPFLTGLFKGTNKLSGGDFNLLAYNSGNNKLEIRDGNTRDSRGNPTYEVLGVIDMNNYRTCLTYEELTGRLYDDLGKIVGSKDHPDILPMSRALLRFEKLSVYVPSACATRQ